MLRRHDCVILPTIGAFIASYKSANINEDWGIVVPPKREITFNASITNNDGLLANSIARRNRVQFETANQQLISVVESIRQRLDQDKEYAIGKLGILHKGEESNLYFEPFKSNNSYNSYYGLQSFKLSTLDEIEKNIAPYSSSSINNKDFRSDKNFYIAVNKKVVKYTAMIMIIFFAAASLSFPPYYEGSNQKYASVLPVTNITQEIVEADNIIKEISDTKSQVIIETNQSAVKDIEDCKEEELSYAIVATMRTEAEAQKFIELSKSKRELRIITSGRMSRVYTDKGNHDEIKKIVATREFQKEFPGAWAWQNKKR